MVGSRLSENDGVEIVHAFYHFATASFGREESDAVDNALIKDGAEQLVRAITHQLPVLKKLLHEFQSDDEASDITTIF